MTLLNIDIEYFNVETDQFNNTIRFIPKELIWDILWDDSNINIPFSNGKVYYVYQDLAFSLINDLETLYPYITVSIGSISVQHNSSTQILVPTIVLNNTRLENVAQYIESSSSVITNYINKRFSLW